MDATMFYAVNGSILAVCFVGWMITNFILLGSLFGWDNEPGGYPVIDIMVQMVWAAIFWIWTGAALLLITVVSTVLFFCS